MNRISLLLLLGIMPLMVGCSRDTAGGVNIWEAVDRDDGPAIERYAASGGDLNVLGRGGSTPLWVALSDEKRESYRTLLEKGADPNVIMSGKRVVTHWAAMHEDAWWLRFALENGADSNLVNTGPGQPLEGPPLKAAISNGTLENVQLLVEHGADIDKPDQFNCDSLADAAAQNKFKIVLYLLDQGADYTQSQSSGISFVDDIRQKVENKDRWFLLKEDRDGVDAVRAWLEARGVDFEAD